MTEKVTQQVWNWRWASNLSDTSNTEVTFPNSWKYQISLWSFAAFSSVRIIFPYFLKWVCFSPEDPHKITVLCLNRKSSWRRRVRRAIHHISTQITWNPQDRKVLFAMLSSGKGANLQLRALSNMCYDHTRDECANLAKMNYSTVGRWLNEELSQQRESLDKLCWFHSLNPGQHRNGKTKNVFGVHCFSSFVDVSGIKSSPLLSSVACWYWKHHKILFPLWNPNTSCRNGRGPVAKILSVQPEGNAYSLLQLTDFFLPSFST